jgi:predicted transcriptional regulator
MSQQPLRSRQPAAGGGAAERISLMISAHDRASLDRIADEKRVSLAWVVRDAVTKYLEQPENQASSKKAKG